MEAAGLVEGNTMFYAPQLLPYKAKVSGLNDLGYISINDMMAAADSELGLHGLTRDGNPNRAYQQALKSALDRVNNNLNLFVQSQPCSYTFAQ